MKGTNPDSATANPTPPLPPSQPTVPTQDEQNLPNGEGSHKDKEIIPKQNIILEEEYNISTDEEEDDQMQTEGTDSETAEENTEKKQEKTGKRPAPSKLIGKSKRPSSKPKSNSTK